MSSKLKALDLTSQAVGFQGIVDFSQFAKFDPFHLQTTANIWMFNESGAGLDVVFQASGNAHYLAAGAWGFFPIAPNDSQAQVTITYLLPNPPVSLLNAIYYGPGEQLPQGFTLGNSPIGIGGTVNTSSVNALTNEGNATGTLVVDIGDAALAQLWQLFTDHFLIKVDQSGVAHFVLRGQTAGNALLLGQTGDTSEVAGSLQVDQTLLANTLNARAASDMTLNVPTGHAYFFQVNGVTEGGIDATGINAVNGVNYNIGRIKDINQGNFSASGTVNHGLSGSPSNVLLCPSLAGSTWTFQASTFTSTQFTATINSALNTNFTAYR